MKLKRWQIILVISTVLLLAFRLTSNPAPDHPYYAENLNFPLVIAHQGGDGVWPGETMLAYQNAVDLGVDVLEMDIHITKDGELIS